MGRPRGYTPVLTHAARGRLLRAYYDGVPMELLEERFSYGGRTLMREIEIANSEIKLKAENDPRSAT